MSPHHSTHAHTRSGLFYGIACYALWGAFPLYFMQMEFASALEIVAHRVIWSLPVCLILLALTRRLSEFTAVLRNPRQLGALTVAALLIAGNWLSYVYAIGIGQVLQAALGYFITPLLSIALGVVVLKERLRPLQWAAVGIGLLAIGVIATGHGDMPWLALALALTFSLYGLSKKSVGRSVRPISSLSVETLVLAPLALGALVWLACRGESHFTSHGSASVLLLMSTGIATSIPLIAFGAAARGLSLTTLGLLQYISPILQFIVAVAVAHETMSDARWAGFVLIWLALCLATFDALRAQRQQRRRTIDVPVMEPAG